GRVVVEHGEAVDQLRSDPPLRIRWCAAQQPGMESLPRERFAPSGLRLAPPEEEPQPGACPNSVRIWLRDVHHLQDFMRFVEEHRPSGQKCSQTVRAAPSVTVDKSGLEVGSQYALAHLRG